MKDIFDLSDTEKRALLKKLLRKRAVRSTSLHPQSDGQRALWFLYQLAPESAAYNISCVAYVPATVDIPRLRSAFQALVDRHPALRTTYATKDGQPVQRVQAHASIDFEVIDARGWNEPNLLEWRKTESEKPFDLQAGPVLRVKLALRTQQRCVLLVMAHHIAIDFWSLDLLLHELQVVYASESCGAASLATPKLRYTEFVHRQSKLLAGARGQELWRYWRDRLAGEVPVLHLPLDHPRPVVQTFRGTSYNFHVDKHVTRSLKALAEGDGATLYMVLLAAFQVLLHRYCEQEDILVGSPAIGRCRQDEETVVGYFTNLLLMRVDCSGDPAFSTLLRRVRDTVLEALEYQEFPFSQLVERLQPARDLSRSPLAQVLFVWDKRRFSDAGQTLGEQAGTDTPSQGSTLQMEVFELGQGGAPTDLMLMMSEDREVLHAALQYNTDLFEESTIARMEGHFQTILKGIAANPHCPLSELPLLTESERNQLLNEWNDTAVVYPDGECLHHLVEAQVARTPDRIAVVAATDGGHGQLTYRELDSKANQLAHRLTAMGIEPEQLVGVCMERSLELVIALIGVLKSGGAFVPLDPTWPVERLGALIQDAGIGLLLAQEKFLAKLSGICAGVLCLDTGWDVINQEPSVSQACNVNSNNLAYVIYTSGSTGNPKGCMITHASIRNRLLWMQERFGLDANDRVLQKSPHTFDVSVWEFFWPLLTGARLIVAEPGAHRDTRQLIRTIVGHGVTTIHFVPSMAKVFVSDPGAKTCSSLKRVFSSGEALTWELQERVFSCLPYAELYNLYGPTEAAIDVTCWKCQRNANDAVVSIGRPIANTQVYILDGHSQLVPVGVSGELHIGGVGLARGYLNKPGLTDQTFIRNPYSDKPHSRLYKTGDWGRFLPSGDIVFLGRRDHQVKIRGVRVELAEVEQALRSHPAISHAVVVATEDGLEGEKRLVAYFTCDMTPVPAPDVLRGFLVTKIPDPLVPSLFIHVDTLPLTPSGKLDRRALPVPCFSRPELETAYVAPRNEVEKVLADIWCEVLNVSQPGVDDNFFVLGGASTQSLELAMRANDVGLQLTPASVFQYETIAKLAAAFGANRLQKLDGAGMRMDERRGTVHQSSHAADEQIPGLTRPNTVIESLGVYLPEREISTDFVLKGCDREVMMPLELLTGIHSRHVAGDDEFSIDLAKKAVGECLARSRYDPQDIDLLICCNISRCDGPKDSFSFEPTTSIRLKHHFGFERALVFDIANACAGMFTGILVADVLLKAGAIRCGMVVSGEYITHLTRTAQRELDDFLDPRLACLTLGDAGAALILECAADNNVGFHALDMFTLSRYSSLCVAKVTGGAHGGAIMLTDSVRQTAITVPEAVKHATSMIARAAWTPESLNHVIMHQTSATTIRDAATAFNRAAGKRIAHDGNMICNLRNRGNTASTSHFVAVRDCVINGRIKPGDKAFFSITGSGQTVGGALYTFDDLPDRMREPRGTGRPSKGQRPSTWDTPRRLRRNTGVRVASAAESSDTEACGRSAVALAAAAAENCIQQSRCDRRDIGLVMHAGVFREEFLSEPAIAALVAGSLQVNDVGDSSGTRRTLAFDVLNGGCGALSACRIAGDLIGESKVGNVLITTAEIENNHQLGQYKLRGIREMGSALILTEASGDGPGFGKFLFKDYTEHLGALASHTQFEDAITYLQVEKVPNLDDLYLDCAVDAVRELLASEGLSIETIDLVLPPQISEEFISRLGNRLGVGRRRIVDVPHDGTDWYTSSIAANFKRVHDEGLARSGDMGLIISVGAGIQVGCALYRF